MNDLELLRLIRERRAALLREELGPIDDRKRAGALLLFVEELKRNPEAARRLEGCSEGLRAFIVGMAAAEPEDPPTDQEPFSEGEPGPEEEPATRVSHVSHVEHEEPNAQMQLPPVEPPPQPEPAPWYESRSQPPGLRRANELKRAWAKPDTGPNAGSSWMKR